VNHRHHVADKGAKLDGRLVQLELSRVNLRQFEHRIDEFEQALSCIINLSQPRRLLGSRPPSL